MQALISFVANLLTAISFRALMSREAVGFYGVLLCVTGAAFGNVAITIVGIGCLYFATMHKPGNGPGFAALVLLVCPFTIGCDSIETGYRALPVPRPEAPVVNPHVSIRQSNWLGPRREGSCAHASLVNCFRWLNQHELGERWKKQWGGDGEYSSRIRERCDAMNVPFAYTEQANLTMLDFAHATRRGAIIWWKPSHCCTFCGWVKLPDGKTYAVILDNNSVSQYELEERSAFHRKWASYGGFALSPLFDPPAPPVYLSYEEIPNRIF